MVTSKRSGAVILSGGATAATDYFLVPHLENLGYEVTLLDCRAEPFESAFSLGNAPMVTRPWQK
ncbi:MAG: hypothetical protein ABI479_11520 [Gallionella sp.]